MSCSSGTATRGLWSQARPIESLSASPSSSTWTERRLMRSRAVAQPFGTYTQPLRLQKRTDGALTKSLITNSFPLAQVREMIASGHPWFRELGGTEWRLLELPTGHWPMFSRPEDLAEVLGDLLAPASQ